MVHGQRVHCILCGRSEETKVTGPLSTKSDVTAHQNCLLYSSGIYCKESPLLDDLFGFSVDDVREEVKRGKQLRCCRCKKTYATAGCEVKRCKKSYHYPCAVEEGAHIVEDTEEGKFGLYCYKHSELQKNNSSVSGNNTPRMSPTTSNNPSEAGSFEVCCLTCEKQKGNISLKSLMNSINMIYCDKHAPSSHKRNINRDSSGAGPSMYNSDSNSSSNSTRASSKRRLSSDDNEEVTPSKRTSKSFRRTISEDSSNSDENPPNSECAPLDDDFAESASFNQESEIRTSTEGDMGFSSEHQQEEENTGGNNEEDGDETFVQSDAESESLLIPVEVCMDSLPNSTTEFATQTECTVTKVVKREQEGSSHMHSPRQSPLPDSDEVIEPSIPQQSSVASPPSPDRSGPQSVTNPAPCTSSSVSPPPPPPPPPPPLPTCITISSSPPSPSDSVPSIDSASFWKSCNTAQCTQAIFSDFFEEMNNICVKIQSDQASQEDYDHALAVIEASGKLEELVTKQQKELLRKREELEKVATAMTEVVSALRR
ncbi:flocculation protein FLO11 isoform X2 [Cheilinus undulatus]|uniref:flocculation protein FLO11 isoform X2 n=1 Tax=Cheilinus undulatus TaxID=241271 RepID=UPI001BD63C39|nr:flocculation protein FLO11 isoform X2 [Cheilinus undulatus]